MRSDVLQKQGVAVRRRLGDLLRGNGGSCAGARIDHHLLAEAGRKPGADSAPQHVGNAACREAMHQANRLLRKIGLRGSRQRRQHHQREHAEHNHHAKSQSSHCSLHHVKRDEKSRKYRRVNIAVLTADTSYPTPSRNDTQGRDYFPAGTTAITSISTIMPGRASSLMTKNVCTGSGPPLKASARHLFMASRSLMFTT